MYAHYDDTMIHSVWATKGLAKAEAKRLRKDKDLHPWGTNRNDFEYFSLNLNEPWERPSSIEGTWNRIVAHTKELVDKGYSRAYMESELKRLGYPEEE